jgi:hypothetical protein
MRRRDFMVGAAAATGLVFARNAGAQGGNADRMSRIAIMSFGLNSIVKDNQPPSPARTLEIMDIGQVCADRFKVHNVSLQSNYLPATEMSWLKDFKSRLAKTKTRVVQVNLEFGAGYNMAAEAPAGRLQMIDLHRVWLEKVAFLECPRVLLNQGQPSPENKELLIRNFRAVTELARAKGITATCENRGGAGGRAAGAAPAPGQAGSAVAPAAPAAPAPPAYVILTEILKAAGTSTCVDFLNFPTQEEQLAGIKVMLPMTSGLLHAGIRYDLAPAMKLCRDANYKGLYCIKAAGLPGDPLENTQTIIDGVLANM